MCVENDTGPLIGWKRSSLETVYSCVRLLIVRLQVWRRPFKSIHKPLLELLMKSTVRNNSNPIKTMTLVDSNLPFYIDCGHQPTDRLTTVFYNC